MSDREARWQTEQALDNLRWPQERSGAWAEEIDFLKDLRDRLIKLEDAERDAKPSAPAELTEVGGRSYAQDQLDAVAEGLLRNTFGEGAVVE